MAEGEHSSQGPHDGPPAAIPVNPSESPPDDKTKPPETVQRAMRKMAEGAPDAFVEMTAMMGPMMGHPLHQKMNEGHITRMLDLAVQHDTNEHDLRKAQQGIDSNQDKWNQCFGMGYFVLFLALVVTILLLFRNQPTVLVPILSGVGGVVTGFLGGVGYAKSKQASSKNKSD